MENNYQRANRRLHNRPAGFSLVEIMIGMAILGIVLGASLMAIPELRAISYRSDHTRSGYTVLNSELENLRTQTFEQLATSIQGEPEPEEEDDDGGGGLLGGLGGLLGLGNDDDDYETPTQVVTHDNVTHNNVNYSVSRQLEFVDGNQEIIRSTVVVDWPGGQTITGQAIFTQNGLSDKKFSTAN